MSDNIDIRIREDGSRVVSRNLDEIAKKADAAGTAVVDMNKKIDSSSGNTTALTKLQSLIKMAESYGTGMVKQLDQTSSSYRNTLMKHFEMVSKSARASASAIKSQMEVLTAPPVGMDAMNAFYKSQEVSIKELVNVNEVASQRMIEANQRVADRQWANAYAAAESAKAASQAQVASEAAAATQRIALNEVAAVRIAAANDRAWSREYMRKQLAQEEADLSKFINNAAAMMSRRELEERTSAEKRLGSALKKIENEQVAEASYTAWWLAEIKKRDAATAASNLRNANQRSGMQALTVERLDRQLIKPAQGTSALSKMYSSDPNVTSNTAGVTAATALTTSNSGLASSHAKVSSAASTSAMRQGEWNNIAKDGHAMARGLSGSLGTLWMTYGSIAPLLAGAAIGSTFMQAAKSGSEFAYQLTFVKALGGESADAIARLSEQAMQLARNSAFGPTDIASGYRVLAQAGLDAADALKIMPEVLNLATVGELSMENAGLAVVGSLNAFKLGMEDASRISDLFAKAAAVSQSSVTDLTQAMKTASTAGTQYKQSVEDTMTALALLAKVNITGTSAGTAYRNMLKEMYTPTKDATKVWAGLNVETTKMVNGQRQVRNFVEIMYDLKKATARFDEPSKGKIIGYLFGERGAKEAAEMLDMNYEQWVAFQNKITNSKGFGAKVAEEMNNTAKNEWKQALNTLEVELVSSFQRMEPQFINLAQQFKTVFESQEFKSAVDTILETLVKLLKGFVELAPVIYDLAKAWLVLKAAQTGAAIAGMLTATATAAQGLAAGMLAASGAMGPVAKGATMLGPVLAALGGPLTIILGLLAAGATAWMIWGRNAETASGKAIKTTQDRLAQLKKEKEFGAGELGDAKAKLAELTNRSELMNSGPRQPIENLKEAQKAVDLQQNLVDLLEEREAALTKINTVSIPKIEVPKQPVGKDIWTPPAKASHDKGASGRLGKDDEALAKMKARLDVSKEEYAMIEKYGQAQFQLNEGQKSALAIQEKITALEGMSIKDLKEKGITGRAEQLASLKKQLDYANQLGDQLKANELLKVDKKFEEELRITAMLPLEREKENKFITFRNELLSKGIVLDEAQASVLRDKIAAQVEFNKVTAIRDNLLANSDAQQKKDFTTSTDGLKAAQQTPEWTQNDTNKSVMGSMSNMGLDTSGMTEMRDAQMTMLQTYYTQVQSLRDNDLINESTYQNALGQLAVKTNELRLTDMNSFFGSLAGLQSSSNKKLGAIGKAAAITQATMDGVNAVQKAYTASPYPWNIAMATAQGALAAANVAKIAGLNFATGGGFTVGGSGGTDSQNVSFRASPGERVSVSTPQQVRKADEHRQNQKANSNNQGSGNVKIINVMDPNLLHDYLGTPAGEKVLVNTLQRNAGAIRSIVNG